MNIKAANKLFFWVVSFLFLLISFYVSPTADAQENTPSLEPISVVEKTPLSTSVPEPMIPVAQISTPVEVSASPIEASVSSELPVESKRSQPVLASVSEIITEEPEKYETDALIEGDTETKSITEFDLSYQTNGSATLQTDKSDYTPTEIVLIMGSGYDINKEYGIGITSGVGNFRFSDRVSSDESGNLLYPYRLDGTYRPDYKVEITNDVGQAVASVSFTDSDEIPPVVDIDDLPESAYNSSNWPGEISGTASDDSPGVVLVEVSIFDGSDYWNGLSWRRPQTWFAADGTDIRTYDFIPDKEGIFTFYSQATDADGSAGPVDSLTFTYDSSLPQISDISDSPDPFSPEDDNGIKDTVAFSYTLSDVFSSSFWVLFDINDEEDVWITTLYDDIQSAGSQAIVWDGTDWVGDLISEGTYFYGLNVWDEAGNQSTSSFADSVTIDNTAPVTVDDVDSGWYNSDVTITFSCSDNLSGCEATFYTIDGSQPTLGSSSDSSVVIDSSGIYPIKYFSVDIAGNPESVKTAVNQVLLDKDLPVSSADNASASWRLSNVIITLSVSDTGGSDIATAKYNWDTSADETTGTDFTNGATISIPSNGNHTLYLYSEDNAGNSSSWSGSYLLDTISPEASWSTPAANSTLSGVVLLEVTGNDTTSGIKEVKFQYKRDDGVDSFHDIATDSSSPYSVNWDSTGLVLDAYILRAVMTDNAGNFANFDESVDIAAVVSGEASTTPSSSSAVITWTTDRLTSSRVVYDTVSHGSLGNAPNYDYSNSTGTSDTSPKVLNHSLTIDGLSAGTVYFYRTISEGSPVAVGDERTFQTLSVAGAPVLSGEDGGLVVGASTQAVFEPIAYEFASSEFLEIDILPDEEVLGKETEFSKEMVKGFWSIKSNKIMVAIGALVFVGLVLFKIRHRK